LNPVAEPRELDDVDVGVVRALFGVALRRPHDRPVSDRRHIEVYWFAAQRAFAT